MLGKVFTEHNYLVKPSDIRELFEGLQISEEYYEDFEPARLYVTDRFNSKQYDYRSALGYQYQSYDYIDHKPYITPSISLDFTIDTNNDVVRAHTGLFSSLDCKISGAGTAENTLNTIVSFSEQLGATGLSEVESDSTEERRKFAYSNWDISKLLNVDMEEEDRLASDLSGVASDNSYNGSILLNYASWFYRVNGIAVIQQYLAVMSIYDYIANM